jgi:tetratricopeptide (TPR) repeat protein
MRNALLLIFTFLLTACHYTTPEENRILSKADSIISAHPDRALLLLRDIDNYRHLKKPDRALYALLMTQALDKCDSVVVSDTLIRIATDYYGRKEPVRAGYSWFYRARCEANQGNVQGRAMSLLKAETYAQQSQNHKLLGFVYGDEAKLYQKQNQLDSALHCYKKSYSHLKIAGDQRNSSVCLLEIGYSLYRNQQYHEALQYYERAINENPHMESLLFSSFRRQQCLVYYKLAKYDSALKYARLSFVSSDVYDYAKIVNMALIFNKQNETDSAEFYLRKCIDPHDMAPDFYRVWLEVSAKNRDCKGVCYYTGKLVNAKDSVYNHSLSESFAGLEKKYKYEDVASQNKSLTINAQHNKILILILLLLLSLCGIIFAIFRNRHNKRLLIQQQLLMEKERALLQGEEEKTLILQKQLSRQQRALSTLNKLRNDLANLATTKKQIQKNAQSNDSRDAINQTVIHVIESVDLLYDNFSIRIKEAFPDLIENEITICCFLLAGFDNVTIYTTLNFQPASYNVKRTNLRKKLGLEHETNLTDFLSKF